MLLPDMSALALLVLCAVAVASAAGYQTCEQREASIESCLSGPGSGPCELSAVNTTDAANSLRCATAVLLSDAESPLAEKYSQCANRTGVYDCVDPLKPGDCQWDAVRETCVPHLRDLCGASGAHSSSQALCDSLPGCFWVPERQLCGGYSPAGLQCERLQTEEWCTVSMTRGQCQWQPLAGCTSSLDVHHSSLRAYCNSLADDCNDTLCLTIDERCELSPSSGLCASLSDEYECGEFSEHCEQVTFSERWADSGQSGSVCVSVTHAKKHREFNVRLFIFQGALACVDTVLLVAFFVISGAVFS